MADPYDYSYFSYYYFGADAPVCYFDYSYFSEYFEICPPAEPRAFFGGHFADPNKPWRYVNTDLVYNRHELRQQLEALLFPKEIKVPGRAKPQQPIEAKIEQVVREAATRKILPIRIPDARPELRRLFWAEIRKAIAHRKEIERLKKKKKKRDAEALLLLWQ